MRRPDRLVIASHNEGKVREIAELLEPLGIAVVSAGSLGLPEPDETATSFTGNAEIKARAAAEASGLPALADDSGLCVAGLDGAPGIFSARWAGPTKDFTIAIEKIRQALGNHPDRRAHFACALTLAWPDGELLAVEGHVNGALTFPPRGLNGFGYDPIFVPDGKQETFGEMDGAAKHAISHRAVAFHRLVAALSGDD
jgi:XTP/dITP diphosphohydrolase